MVLPLARPKPERLRERRVPTEAAWPFDRPAPFVAIRSRGRNRKRARIEKVERRSATNTHVRIAHLLGALRKIRARSGIVRRSAAKIRGKRRPRMPRNNILQTPVAEHVLCPPASSEAVPLAERQLIQGHQPHLMPHVERR